MNILGKNAAATIAAILITAAVVVLAQPTSAQASYGNRPTLQTPSGHATTYFDFPIQRLKVAVPALKGLEYEASQEQLPSILTRVAKTIADVLPRLPNLVSREQVFHFQSMGDDDAPGGLANMQPWSREYKYLILCSHNPDGSTSIKESRTDSKGRPADAPDLFTTPRGYGFAYQWLFFSAANQPEFRFRYLGRQEKDGRKTFVVAFAQNPHKVTHPAFFQSGGKIVRFYFQGVLWVDQSTFDIVTLRTDLMDPPPELHLTQMTTELTFRSVPIHGLDTVFWLPSVADISSNEGSGTSEETHRYSDYHLYHSTARILP